MRQTARTALSSSVPAELPEIPAPATVSPADARTLSKLLFQQLEQLEEGTPQYAYARNTLVELNMALVKFAAARFRTRSEPMADIIQVGTVGLIKAINRFEPGRGLEFPTFALPTITGEIKRFFRDTSWAVRVPRRLQELRLTLARATETLQHELDRSPTVAELAVRLDLTGAEVEEGLRAGRAYSAGSLDAAAEEGAGSAGEQIGSEDAAIALVDDHESLKPLIAELSPRDRQILSLRFGAELTQSEIGEELGLSQMHVSRLLTRTLGTLRAGLLAED